MPKRTIQTPLGPMLATSENEALIGLSFDAEGEHDEACPILDLVEEQLESYFEGDPVNFDIPLAPKGTPFQHRVWDALRTVPKGETRSYTAIARQIGSHEAVRAVGAANGANPIAIIIPCHRVIASDGRLHGYAGGLERKRELLDLETKSLFTNNSD
ncbi:MAG: methylated-DNA--[protein]-cysteine S-methyltransferase [Phycisphaerales bacterium JB050]